LIKKKIYSAKNRSFYVLVINYSFSAVSGATSGSRVSVAVSVFSLLFSISPVFSVSAVSFGMKLSSP
jgi:hypothetical protein